VSALGNPADILVALSALEDGRPESARIVLGSFPAPANVNAGVVRSGVLYRLRATAAFAAVREQPIGGPVTAAVTPNGTSTSLLITIA
jgi:hypothetical protein